MAVVPSPENFIWECPVTGEAIAIPEHVIVREGYHQATLPSYDGVPYEGAPLSQPVEYRGHLTVCPTPNHPVGILAVENNSDVHTKMFRVGQTDERKGYFDAVQKKFRPIWNRRQAIGKTLLVEIQVTELFDLDYGLLLPRYKRYNINHAQLFI